MATNIAFTLTDKNSSGRWNRAQITGSAAPNKLDTAADVTAPLSSVGFKNHDFTGTLASVGTSVVVAIEIRLTAGGSWVEVVASSAITANGTFRLTYAGFAHEVRGKLKTITAGSPEINTISLTSYDRYL